MAITRKSYIFGFARMIFFSSGIGIDMEGATVGRTDKSRLDFSWPTFLDTLFSTFQILTRHFLTRHFSIGTFLDRHFLTKLDISRPGHFSTGTFLDRDISGPGFSKCDFSIVSGYLMLGEMWRMHNESDFFIVSGSQWPNGRGDVENAWRVGLFYCLWLPVT